MTDSEKSSVDLNETPDLIQPPKMNSILTIEPTHGTFVTTETQPSFSGPPPTFETAAEPRSKVETSLVVKLEIREMFRSVYRDFVCRLFNRSNRIRGTATFLYAEPVTQLSVSGKRGVRMRLVSIWTNASALLRANRERFHLRKRVRRDALPSVPDMGPM